MRAPMDSFTSSPVAKKSGTIRSKSGGKGANKGIGANTEGKRAKRAEANKK